MQITVEGQRETIRRLEALPVKVQKRVLRKAVTAGASPYLKAARAGAPRRSGLFARSLASVIRVYPRAGSVVALIGQERGKSWQKRAARIRAGKRFAGLSGRGEVVPIHLVESGSKPHQITGRRESIRIRSKDFLGRQRRKTVAFGAVQGVLRWEGSGQAIYARRVRHPGTRGTGFLAAAYASASGEASQRLEAKLTAEIEREAVTP